MLDVLFPTPEGMQPQMLFWIFLCYGYILFSAANLLSDGSELLLFIPEAAGLVGSVVLPVLGAVPDGMMVLFSGVGTLEKAQESVAVGVGALAGSTIMLLTIPWFLGVIGGRVDIEGGKCQYSREDKLTQTSIGGTLFRTGISYKPEIRANAKIMLMTSLTYLIIQVPAFMSDSQRRGHIGEEEIKRENSAEGAWALLAMVLCTVEFAAYLYVQYAASLPEEKTKTTSSADIIKEKISGWIGKLKDLLGSSGLAPAPSRNYASAIMRAQELGVKVWMEEFRKDWKLTDQNQEKNKALLDKVFFPKEFNDTLKYWFGKYATGPNGRISVQDVNQLLRDLGLTGYSADELFHKVDSNNDGDIDLEEFTECFKHLASMPPTPQVKGGAGRKRSSVASPGVQEDDEDEEEEEESVPEEFADLEPAEQRRQILMQSCYKMGLGTLLVLIFSDPMVDVLVEIGNQSGVPAFYVSFILAPLASNSSELVAAYNYASRRTSKTITIALNTLEGAACMNNTFCLGIFMGLIYFQGLAWKFTAETISIVVIQLAMAIIVLAESTQRVIHACGILMLFPGALALVYVLENYCGLD
eukprot:gb/GFBE01065179.1/.p1 GENE.gb/GFBE01065179.1/~~gb/GFBE01065179.1/.p1  ORF type:complete len:584 (+),score=169.39 gb/GFBE01065179.1/:1-1752(+)